MHADADGCEIAGRSVQSTSIAVQSTMVLGRGMDGWMEGGRKGKGADQDPSR